MFKKSNPHYYFSLAMIGIGTTILPALQAFLILKQGFVSSDYFPMLVFLLSVLAAGGGYLLGKINFTFLIKEVYQVKDFTDGAEFKILSLDGFNSESLQGEFAKVLVTKDNKNLECTVQIKKAEKPTAEVGFVYTKMNNRLFLG